MKSFEDIKKNPELEILRTGIEMPMPPSIMVGIKQLGVLE